MGALRVNATDVLPTNLLTANGGTPTLPPRERGSLFESKSRYDSSYAWVCDDDANRICTDANNWRSTGLS